MKLAFTYPKRFTIYPPDYLGRGLGGTESLLITLTRELAKVGHEVTVYANAYREGTYDDVEWKSIWKSKSDRTVYDFQIILRYLEAFDYSVKADKTVIWSHDNFYDSSRINNLFAKKKLDKIIVVSKYHKKITQDFLPDQVDNIVEIPNSYDNYLYDKFKDVTKERFKCIYCSVPIRGLHYLLGIWDELSQIIPEAKLYITSDMTLWGITKQDDQNAMNSLYSEIQSRKNIFRLGNIPKEEVAYHQASSEIMLYPTDFDELFCISTLECLSLNTPVISSDRAGLTERIKSKYDGKLIKGDPDSTQYQTKFLDSAIDFLKDPNKLLELNKNAQSGHDAYSIKNIVKIWDNFFINNIN